MIGNHGRLLDARRTPVEIVDLRPELAWFVVEVQAFEDRGARWELAMDTVDRYQFALGSTLANPQSIEEFEAAIRHFDTAVDIAIDPASRSATMKRLADERTAAQRWFGEHSTWARDDRVLDLDATAGDPRLFADLDSFLAARDLTKVETSFSHGYVSNPSAGEAVRRRGPAVDDVLRDGSDERAVPGGRSPRSGRTAAVF